ncbi:polyketide synthase [Fusarium beomiforme]|uniref:Polyketide synthase n=1 Tax=Fusarium beomiforme TaxID=44412 RepID=A0A9P5ADA9_9HYPO|nr:polyketide synthase [Fusarium beomiforme]
MASSTQEPSAMQVAKPTVRLKGKNNEFGESLELDDFLSQGRREKDLMDEERWLNYTADDTAKWKEFQGLYKPATLATVSSNDGRCSNPKKEAPVENQVWRKRIIWNPAVRSKGKSIKQTVRMPTEKYLAFTVLARACKKNRAKSEHLAGLLDSSSPTVRGIKAVFVGISIFDCQPVFLVRDNLETTYCIRKDISEEKLQQILMRDDTCLCDLTKRAGRPPQGHDVIWVENMLIPGNISHAKHALYKRLELHDEKKFVRIMRRENSLLEAGLGAAGIAKTLPSSEVPERKPVMCRPIHNAMNYDTLHYRLRWPPMAVLEFPSDMINAMKVFLQLHPNDNVPLNIALAATIIYFDLEELDGHQSKGLVHFIREASTIKKASLGMFIIYFPHMLRFVENTHLTAFIHPSRFAITHHARDTEGDSNGDFKVISHRDRISTADMRAWCSEIRSLYPQVSSNFRFNLVPSSIPGPGMVFPQDLKSAEKPTSDLFTLCCLDDIRTMGLPSYQYRKTNDLKEKFRLVGGPEWIFSSATNKPSFHMQGVPYSCYWTNQSVDMVSSLTGPAREIGFVFPDVGSDYYRQDAITSCVERWFGPVSSYTQNFQLCEDLQRPARKSIANRANELNRIADRLGIPSSERWTSHKTLCPQWHGMEAHLNSLYIEGKLKRFATQEQPLPQSKRPKPAEPFLDAERKEKILGMIDGLAALSCDWDSLRERLKSPQTTMKSVQESFSHVRLFASDLEKTLRAENAENGQGSLDKVIRVAFRAEGLFSKLQIETLDYKSRWDQHHDRFAKFGQATGDAMETIFRLRDSPDAFRLILHIIQVLKESPMIKEQVPAYKKIDALLSPA